LNFIGLEAARRIIMASVFQPLFASAGLRTLWRHSVEMAESAAHIAAVSGRVAPNEAFLAGLVHDIGRLALQKLPHEDAVSYARLLERGADPVFAELTLCGFDHGDAGAEILRLWSFPVAVVDAVQHHHWPERVESPLAAVLYLAEENSGSAEDAPSWVRLADAEDRLGVSTADLTAHDSGMLNFLVA
jgi:putative nucleotidyltransferase with HDIG domain